MDTTVANVTKTAYHLEAVQTIVAESTKTVSVQMMQALMQGLQEKLDFKALAERHINKKLDEELSQSDEQTQIVYTKLYAASKEHISKFSGPFLGKTLVAIEQATNSTDSSRLFLGSFVLPETKAMIQQLQQKEPKSLEDKQLWKNS